MTVRHLTAPLDEAMAEAAAALAAEPAGTSEEWVLPDENHALSQPLSIDVSGRLLVLRGGDHCVLDVVGGLEVIASAVDIVELGVVAIDAAYALRIAAPRIRVMDADVDVVGGAVAVGLDLDAGPDGTVDAEDIRVNSVDGLEAIGLRARGGDVRVTGAEIGSVVGNTATGLEVGAVSDAEVVAIEVNDVDASGGDRAIGVLVAGGGRVQVARIVAAQVQGDVATGVAVLGFTGGPGMVGAVDLDVSNVHGADRATGILIAAPRPVSMRGFTVTAVDAAAASGAIVIGGARGDDDAAERSPDIEVGFGRISNVVGADGDAGGLRVIAAPSPRPVIVRDVSVARVAGAPVPDGPVPPRDGDAAAWQVWAEALQGDLADDATPRTTAPAILDAADVVGLAVTAVVDEIQPFLDDGVAGDLAVIDCSVRTVSGSAIQVETLMRPVWLRRAEIAEALRAGWISSDQTIAASTTWDRLGAALVIAPGEIRAFDSIFTRVAGATPPVVLDPDADWGDTGALFSDRGDERFSALDELPYRAPGADELPAELLAGTLPPENGGAFDLRLVQGSSLHRAAVAPPPDDLELGDDDRLFVGAHPPDAAITCELYDPLRPGDAVAPRPQPPGPLVDYRARDARSMFAAMMARADVVMRPWTDRGPADMTTMVLEAAAERLDHLAYAQERAVAEGFLEDARLRRSVEDHVRPLDYLADPGLSAVAMLAFSLDQAGVAGVIAERTAEAAAVAMSDPDRAAWLASTIAALDEIADDGAVEIPAGTLAANRRNDDQVVVFATEEPLPYFPDLDAMSLVQDLPAGATSARVLGVHPGLVRGRWLVLSPGEGAGHVVRVTTVATGTDVVEVGWDPRRPLPWPLPAEADPDTDTPAGVVLGNVVPAHHGVPLAALTDDAGGFDNPALARYRELLEIPVQGGPGTEVVLPYSPVSVHASGYPLPGDEGRRGRPQIRVLVDGDEWTRVDDLAGADPGAEVFALRTSADGRASLRFGDGISSGAMLPARQIRLRLDVTIGLGREGNLGAGVLGRLLFVPVDTARGPITGWLFREEMDVIRGLLAVTNPIPAVGGRAPETADRMRYRAPLMAARPLSAITAEDYQRVARALPDVAGAFARVVRAAVRPVVRVTVLLRDEDTIDDDERLRRWAAVRAALEGARLLGYDVESVPPRWTPLDLDVVVDADDHAEAGAVRDAVIGAVAGNGGLLDPDVSGLGGDVHLADLYRAVLGARGVAAARIKRFRRLAPGAPERLDDGVIAMGPDEVAVVRGPRRPDADGVLTVSVCGGLR